MQSVFRDSKAIPVIVRYILRKAKLLWYSKVFKDYRVNSDCRDLRVYKVFLVNMQHKVSKESRVSWAYKEKKVHRVFKAYKVNKEPRVYLVNKAFKVWKANRVFKEYKVNKEPWVYKVIPAYKAHKAFRVKSVYKDIMENLHSVCSRKFIQMLQYKISLQQYKVCKDLKVQIAAAVDLVDVVAEGTIVATTIVK